MINCWFTRVVCCAADQGYAFAQSSLGRMYDNGDGVSTSVPSFQRFPSAGNLPNDFEKNGGA